MKQAIAIAWVSLFLLGGTAAAQPLKGRALENVMAFTRLLGYVQYFHPSDQAAETDWTAFATEHIEAVEGAGNARELASTLGDLFRPYAPTLRVYPQGTQGETPPALAQPDAAKALVMWAYVPLGSGDANQLAPGDRLRVPIRKGRVPEHVTYKGGEGLRRLPEPIELELPKPNEPLMVTLGGGVRAALPLTLYADASGTLPHVKAPEPLQSSATPPNDRGARLATVAFTWNVFQHFFSYWDTVDTDWQASLRSALQKAAEDESGLAFLVTLERLTDGLRDGHTRTDHPTYSVFGRYNAPFTVDRVEGELVVTTVVPDNPTRIRPGDALLEINAQPAETALRKMLTRVSGVGQWGRYQALTRLLSNDDGIPLTVKLAPYGGGAPYQLQVTPEETYTTALREARPAVVAQLAPGILYVDLTRVEEEQFSNVIKHLANAEGVVFDMRGYPNQFAFDLLAYLADKPLETAPFLFPVVVRPDHRATRFVDGTPTWAEPKEPKLTDKLAFIINGNAAISYSESIMGLLERHGVGARVGEPTAGANGNVVSLDLPGGYSTRWTGLRVTKAGGKPLFTVGVTPTIPVQRTREGVAAGRDELLERAFEIVAEQDAEAMTPREIELPPPAPPTLTLVPLNVEAGVRTVRPQEWTEVQPGIFLRQGSAEDVAALLVRAQAGTRTEVLQQLRQETGLKAGDLKPADRLEAGAFTWQISRFNVSEEGIVLKGTVATTAADGKTLLVLLQGAPGEYDQLHQKVLMPVLKRFSAR